MKMLKASWSICGSGEPIEARQIEIETPHGVIQIGLDNEDCLYVQSVSEMSITPQSTHRVKLKV